MSAAKISTLVLYAVLAALAFTMGDTGIGTWSLYLLVILAIAPTGTDSGAELQHAQHAVGWRIVTTLTRSIPVGTPGSTQVLAAAPEITSSI